MLNYSKPSADGSRAVFTADGRHIGTLCGTITSRAAAVSPGLQGWSTNRAPLIIFSACESGAYASVNNAAHVSACRHLKLSSVWYGVAEGCYKGEREHSIIAEIHSDADERIVRGLAESYNQETVLYVTGDRAARLETPQGEHVADVGKVTAVSRRVAQKHDAWTRLPVSDQYYICE